MSAVNDAVSDVSTWKTESTVPDGVYFALNPQPTTGKGKFLRDLFEDSKTMDDKIEAVAGAIYDYRNYSKMNFTLLVEKMDGMEKRMDSLDKRMDTIENLLRGFIAEIRTKTAI